MLQAMKHYHPDTMLRHYRIMKLMRYEMLENSEKLNQARIPKFNELLLKMKAPADSCVLSSQAKRIDVLMTMRII